MKVSRRTVLGGAAALAVSARAGATGFGRGRYDRAMIIDGLSSLGPLDPEGPAVASQLAAYRASGLTAIHQTVGAAGNTAGRFEETLRRIARYGRFVRAFPDRLLHIRAATDLRAAQDSGRLGVIFGFQDTVPLETDAGRLDLFDLLGVRIVQLTYNKRNLVGDGCLEPGNAGLSDFGREVVAGLNARRMMVDASHASQRHDRERRSRRRARRSRSATPAAARSSTCRATPPMPNCARWPIAAGSRASISCPSCARAGSRAPTT